MKENAQLLSYNQSLGLEVAKLKAELKAQKKKIVFYKEAYKTWKELTS